MCACVPERQGNRGRDLHQVRVDHHHTAHRHVPLQHHVTGQVKDTKAPKPNGQSCSGCNPGSERAGERPQRKAHKQIPPEKKNVQQGQMKKEGAEEEGKTETEKSHKKARRRKREGEESERQGVGKAGNGGERKGEKKGKVRDRKGL